jgi:hypothetical protein
VPATVPADNISRAIREGLADAAAATYPAVEFEQLGWHDFNYGEDWVILDGDFPYSSAVRRDLRVPRQLSFIYSTTDFHTASMAVGNFFYRLRLALGGIYPQEMLALVQRTMKVISDVEGDGKLDLLDLKRAVLVAAPVGWASAINSTWETMSAQQIPGSEVPAPPGAPNTPAWVLSAPTGCINGFSTYSVSWQAPSNTTYYITFVRLPNSLAYTVSDRIDAPQNWGYGYANYNTDGRVAACNSAGCSLMSATSAAMPHNQCGG